MNFENGAEAMLESDEVKKALTFWHLMKDPPPSWVREVEKYYKE